MDGVLSLGTQWIPISTQHQNQATATVQETPQPLHHYIEAEPDTTTHAYLSTIWTVASYVTLVAFFAFAIIGNIFVGLHAQDYLPFVSITALTLAMPVINLYQTLQGWANEEEKYDKTEHTIAAMLATIPRTDEAVRDKLQEIGINPSSIQGVPDLTRLRNIISRYEVWNGLSTTARTERLKIDTKTPDPVAENPTPEQIINCLHNRRIKFLELKDVELNCRAIAAYMFGLIQNPFSSIPDVKDFLLVVPYNVRLRETAFAQAFQEPEYKTLLVFKNSPKAPLNIDEVEGLDMSELAKRIFTPAPLPATPEIN